jgi:hypothetical protein
VQKANCGAGVGAQVVETCLASAKALSSNSSTAKKKKKSKLLLVQMKADSPVLLASVILEM